MRGRSKRRAPDSAATEQERVSLQLIAKKLERLTWRRRLWGADERQVWHVIHRMDEMYRQLYREQEVRYQALLSQARGQAASPRSPDAQPQPTLQASQPSQDPGATRTIPQQAARHLAQSQTPGSSPSGASWL